MYGMEKLTSVCGLGCKMFWPWHEDSERQYGFIQKEDMEDDMMEGEIQDDEEGREASARKPVIVEPPKPVWTDLESSAPIVKNRQITPIVKNKQIRAESFEKISVSPKLENGNVHKPLVKAKSDKDIPKSQSKKEVKEMVQMVSVV
ncbi:hypothetical protein CHS0354_033133 [Potamilus streckersoni]|uniref:Uncharacterized protein n=1 Tax=Potamilus streckersoni TaxID=2493646 RepID=A0AAE0S6P2_9BIVA|nr:hypothetical protein CHS0354_033133 [Potamilus streckersoni]